MWARSLARLRATSVDLGAGVDARSITATPILEGSAVELDITLNKAVPKGELHYLGTQGWSEGLVNKVRGSDQEYQYSMNHTPGPNYPIRRVEIFNLPYGAELLETTPADIPHRVLADGRVGL